MWTVYIDRRGVQREICQFAVILALIALLAPVPSLHATLAEFFLRGRSGRSAVAVAGS